jgi:hypothetical protein
MVLMLHEGGLGFYGKFLGDLSPLDNREPVKDMVTTCES